MSLDARVIEKFSAVERADWERLGHRDNPFLSYAFLAGLEETGSIGEDSGWHPHHLAVYENGRLAAFAPTYAKDNSHGEFVFDWAWADAYRRNGLPYYPKLLTGVPYTPVTGPRLLVRRDHSNPAALKGALYRMALESCRDGDHSTWHCNFVNDEDFDVLKDTALLQRHDWQFHWFNRGYGDFDDFLATFRSRKRKNIRRERKQVAATGVRFHWKSGGEITEDELDFVYFCYIDTFRNYGNYPALKKSFFRLIAGQLGERFQVVFAQMDDEQIAMAVFLAGGGRLYGRYWGSTVEIPGLHFETAYYQGIEFCIANGLEVFESGAQGEHKIARGFVPTKTRSCHHVEHPLFRRAIAEHLEREKAWIDGYREQLDDKIPYRQ